MLRTFQCPNCHASLDYEEDSRAVTIRCAYCNSTVIVPESLRTSGRTSEPFVAHNAEGQKILEIMSLVHDGNKIAAIKLFRETFHVSLKDAKDAVEAMERNEAVQIGSYSGQSPAAGRIIGCIVVAIVLITGLSIAVPLIVAGGLAAWIPTSTETDRIVSTAESGVSVFSTLAPLPSPSPTPGFATVVQQFGGQEGIGPGFFKDTRRIGVDSKGNIYTGDYSGGRIQAFDSSGRFLAQWTVRDDLYMIAMTVDRQGVVYIADRTTLSRYDGLTGAPLEPLAYPGQTNFRNLATAPDGSIVALAPDRLARFDSQGKVTLDVQNPFSNLSGFEHGQEDVTVDGAGNIYVLTRESVFKFDANGRFVNRFGSKGDAPDQFRGIATCLAVDGQGRVYVNAFNGILVFDSNGRYLDTIALRGLAYDMLFTDQNELLVMDRNGNQVLKYVLNK